MSADVVRLAAIREQPLSVDEVLDAVRTDEAGGTAVFIGTVRDVDGGKAVTDLGYSAHPDAERQMRALCESVAQRFPVGAIAAVHRTGDLAIGDIAVVVAAACPHRGDAFDAARTLIDELKATVPIWKHQRFTDGSDEWVGVP